MQVSRVVNRASIQHKLFMLAVPFRSVNRRAATTYPPGQASAGLWARPLRAIFYMSAGQWGLPWKVNFCNIGERRC
jgi:hypothetical protein